MELFHLKRRYYEARLAAYEAHFVLASFARHARPGRWWRVFSKSIRTCNLSMSPLRVDSACSKVWLTTTLHGRLSDIPNTTRPPPWLDTAQTYLTNMSNSKEFFTSLNSTFSPSLSFSSSAMVICPPWVDCLFPLHVYKIIHRGEILPWITE